MEEQTLENKVYRLKSLLNEEYGKITDLYPVVMTDYGLVVENNFYISGVRVEVLFNFRGIKGEIWHGEWGSGCVLSEYNRKTKEWCSYDHYFSDDTFSRYTLFRLEKMKKPIVVTKLSIRYDY